MRTAEELYQYCEDNKLTDGQSRKWGLKHFGVVAAQLEPDEDVRMAFIGLHNQDGMKNDGNFAYAVTNKRILLGQKKLTGQDLATVMLPQITDVSTSTGMLLGTVTIHFVGGIINIGMSKPTAQAVSDKLHALLAELQGGGTAAPAPAASAADEIKKYKELLDLGAITQEEFDAKKKQLLGL